MRIYHLVNVSDFKHKPELAKAQEITLNTMRKAKDFCENKDSIHLIAVPSEKMVAIDLTGFFVTEHIPQTIRDYLSDSNLPPLPLISDVLLSMNQTDIQKDDFIIYTNVDICLQPYFYDYVMCKLTEGYDALIINRRRISKHQIKQAAAFQYADLGKSHPGFDCFVFPFSNLNELELNSICIGIPFLEVTLLHNIVSLAKRPLFIPDAHLTFHIGMDVLPPVNKKLYWHNRTVFFKEINPRLKSKYNLWKFPYDNLPFPIRSIKWMLNPGIFIRTYLELEYKNRIQKLMGAFNEIRWRILQR
ncbi:MAG: hypothetical protein RL264_811 [Bacteroidota bacterium]|jgi:hypothetical protein